MDREAYTMLGYAIAWCVKYIFIPFGVVISSKIIYDKLLRPQPQRQRKKRFNKNRLK